MNYKENHKCRICKLRIFVVGICNKCYFSLSQEEKFHVNTKQTLPDSVLIRLSINAWQ